MLNQQILTQEIVAAVATVVIPENDIQTKICCL